ncbi:HNH endonuclease [Pantoea sp. MBD-2R]|uniref:HNH endonuclease n=1 Tax=Pantoea sp. MBD-2R TaxID=3141540 RepID=UPI0031844EDC
MKDWVIYVGGKASKNYAVGKKTNTWGIKKINSNSEFETIKSGDKITFVFNVGRPKNLFPVSLAGFPRVKTCEYYKFQGEAEEIATGTVTISYYKESKLLWEDDIYEHRFGFEIDNIDTKVLFTADYIGHELVKKTVISFHNKGDAVALDTVNQGTIDKIEAPIYTAKANEGSVSYLTIKKIERDSNLAKLKKAQFLSLHQNFFCEVCHFSFSEIYGEQYDYIECHHIHPLSQSGETETTLSDLILLCANCHRVVHQKSGCMTIEQLKEIIEKQNVQQCHSPVPK